MTPEERQELVDRLRSLADGIEDGQTIQTRDTDCWRDRGDAYFQAWLNSVQCVRVKPEPLEGWVNVYCGGSMKTHLTEHNAKNSAGTGAVRVAVHVREVTDQP